MRPAFYLLTLLLALNQFSHGQEIPIPENYSLISSVTGDLDKDSIAELAVVYNMGPEKEIEGVPRELIIYKLIKGSWTEWKKSKQAVYGSKEGGMMGDPFAEIIIDKGILQISHHGGSSWKWTFTDKYRFQNGEFYLIGYTGIEGKQCAYWREVDFNLSTGKMVVKKEFEKCKSEEEQEIYKRENEILYKKGLKITLQNRQEKEIKISTPRYGHDIYIAIGKEQFR